jgi:transcriptional regulator with XRE-family HTH domain
MAPESPHETTTRQELGRQLEALRLRAGLTTTDVAGILRITESTVRRYERGATTMKYADLEILLNRYGVRRPDERQLLHEMREQGDQRVWWSKYRLPDHTIKLLSFESQATRIRIFELAYVAGPIQTEAYARAIIRACDLRASDEEVERYVRLRMERQQRVYRSGSRPKLQVILAEPILHCPVGGQEVMAEQLEYLLKGPYPYDVRILPLSIGAHPGMMSAFHLFHFGSLDRKPALYVEGPKHYVYIEDEETVAGAEADFDHLWTLALGMEESRRMIVNILKEEYNA